jgi:predicted transposase YdaD
MIRDILRDSSVAQGWFEEGRQEGRQEGRREGQRELVRQALEDRFGTVEPEVLAALTMADAATLRALVVHLATDTPAQVRQRLGLG